MDTKDIEAKTPNVDLDEMLRKTQGLFSRLTKYDNERSARLERFDVEHKKHEARLQNAIDEGSNKFASALEVRNQELIEVQEALRSKLEALEKGISSCNEYIIKFEASKVEFNEKVEDVPNIINTLEESLNTASGIVTQIKQQQSDAADDVGAYTQQKERIIKLEEKLNGLIFNIEGEDEADEDALIRKVEDLIEELKTGKQTFYDQMSEQKMVAEENYLARDAKLKEIMAYADNVVGASTDASLHDAFSERARMYTNSSYALGAIVAALLLVIFGFAFVNMPQTITADWDIALLLLVRILVISPIVILSIMVFRAYNVQKILAEEYTHKAALTKSIAGYRNLFELEHEDIEYMELFNAIKAGLIVNPSDKVATLLKGKSPQEEMMSEVTKAVQENLDKVVPSAKNVKEFVKEAVDVEKT